MTNELATVEMNSALDQPKRIEGLLVSRRDELGQLLAETGISPERFTRTVIHALAKNPDVLKCSVNSVLLSVLEAARMGLEPTGAYGGAYLIRRKSEAVLEVDYRGFIRMAMRSGAISRALASAVYSGDSFDWVEGTQPRLDHRPTQGPARGEDDRGDLTHVYGVAWLPDGSSVFRVMTREEINAIMSRTSSKVNGKVVGPWISDYIAMALKTVIRQLFKWMPAVYNPALQYALEREDTLAPLTTETHEEAPARPATRRDTIVAELNGEPAPDEPEGQPADEGAGEELRELPPEEPAEEAAASAASRRRPARR